MRLRGILDSKGRRAVWERNQAYRMPPAEPASVHKPLSGENGTIHCCGSRFSPAAHQRHTRGEPLHAVCSGVFVIDGDSWLAIEDARIKAARNEIPADDEAIRRQELIDAYYVQQGRGRRHARRVSGTSEWMTD